MTTQSQRRFHGIDLTRWMCVLSAAMAACELLGLTVAEGGEVMTPSNEELETIIATLDESPLAFYARVLLSERKAHAEELAEANKRADELERRVREWELLEDEWDVQAVGNAMGLHLGKSIRKNILPYIQGLQGERDELAAMVNELRGQLVNASNILEGYRLQRHILRNGHLQEMEAINAVLGYTPEQFLADHDAKVRQEQRDKDAEICQNVAKKYTRYDVMIGTQRTDPAIGAEECAEAISKQEDNHD